MAHVVPAEPAVARDERFEGFVAARYGALCRTAYLLCGDWHHAQDLVQSALAIVYLRRNRVDNFEAYTRTTLIRAYSSWRRRRWHGETPTAEPPEPLQSDETDAVVQRRVLLQALGRLSPEQRAVIVLRFLDDLSEAETAAMLGCSPGTVKSRTSRALRALRANGNLAVVPLEGDADVRT